MVGLISAWPRHAAAEAANTWPPRRSAAGDAAAPVGAALVGLGLLLLIAAASQEPGVGMLALAVAATLLAIAGGALALWGLAYRQMAYVLGEDELRIVWFGRTLLVPYAAIQGIYTGQRLGGTRQPGMPCWPGIYIGPARMRGIGRLRFFATSPDPAELTLVTFEHGGVVLSARDPHAFRAALIEHVQNSIEGPDARFGWQAQDAGVPPWSAVVDRWWQVSTAVGLVLLLASLAAITLGFQPLPDVLPLHFDATGQTTQLGPKTDLLRLPAIGLLGLLVNGAWGVWAHAGDRLLARVLWVGGAGLQAMLLVAVVRLVQ